MGRACIIGRVTEGSGGDWVGHIFGLDHGRIGIKRHDYGLLLSLQCSWRTASR